MKAKRSRGPLFVKGEVMRSCFYLFATAALVAPSFAYADEPVDIDQIVVTADRAPRLLSQVGQSISVITSGDIATRQSDTVVELLRTVPGVTFTRNGGVGATTQVNIRGAESDQTVALIDGVKLNDPSATGAGFNFGNLMVGNIERIEVLRGSQSVLWGSQAIGGVVNMITREPGDNLAVNARAEYGYRNTANVVGNVSGRFGPVAASVGAGYFRTDGISTFDENLGGKEKDDYRNLGANAKFVVTLSDAVSVDLRGYYSDGKVGIDGFPPPNYVFGDTGEYAKTREFVGYSGLNVALFDGKFRNRFAFAYTDTKRDNFDPASVPVQTFDANGRNRRFEYQGVADLTGWAQATIGAETERSSFHTASYGFASPPGHATLNSGYGQLSVTPVSGLTATGGVRYDHHSTFGGATTFAANAVYSPNKGATTFRASYGEGFKAPSLYQLYSDYGNRDLVPERSESWDAGVTQKLIDGRMELAATWFHRNTHNQIDFISCFGSSDPICRNHPYGAYDNIRRTQARGVEVGVTLTPVDALRFQANYSWIDATNQMTGLNLARRPRNNVNVSVDYRWPFGLETGATVTHVSASFDDVANQRRLEGYVLADLRASFPILKSVSFYGRIENLFDEKYETIYRYGTPGRAAYAGVRLSY